jgi:EpsI family protein
MSKNCGERVPANRLQAVSFGLLGAVACLIALAQLGASRMLSFDERTIPTPRLAEIPMDFGVWKSAGEQSLDKGVVDYLSPDAYILRDYSGVAAQAPLNLFVAHFRSLDKSYGPHSPRICLPGAGWLISSSHIAKINVPGRTEPIPVNEYVMEKGNQRILVLYWYQNDRRIWAEEYSAKVTLLPDLIRYRRSDVSLIRIITNMRDRTDGGELADSIAFIDLLFPQLQERLTLASS